MRKLLALIMALFFFIPNIANTYSVNRTKYGRVVRWSEGLVNQKIYFNPANRHGLSDDEVERVLRKSSAQWNDIGWSNISLEVSDTNNISNRNDVYFSRNPLYFSGAGVLAVTQTSFYQVSGTIVESDILIKDTTILDDPIVGVDFSVDPTATGTYYLGDVVTHEMGHFVSLGHSQVMDSSMIYTYRRGTASVFSDDVYGVQGVYGQLDADSTGTIIGRVVGGSDLVGILGAHIKIVSARRGTVVGGTFTDDNGNFNVVGIELDDTYYLYIEPGRSLENIPPYYSEARSDFCPGGEPYRGNFFGSCNNSDTGYPTGIHLSSTSNEVDVGSITISCGLDAPADYVQDRETGFELPIIDGNLNIGNAHTGFFTAAEASNNTPNIINVDLTSVTIPSNDYYLDVKVIFQSLYSRVQMDVEVADVDTSSRFSVSTDSDGNPVLDVSEKINMNTDSTKNDFTITLTPTDFATYFIHSASSSVEDFYPGSSDYGDDLILYFVIVNVVRADNGEYVPYMMRRYPISDNKLCPDAPLSYSVSANLSNLATELYLTRDEEGEESGGCGTVDFGGSSGSGPLSFVLGLLLILIPHTCLRNNKFA